MAPEVVRLNMLEICGFGNPWNLVQLLQVVEEVWILTDSTNVAFEMRDVNNIETHKGGEKSPVRHSDFVADKIS